MSPAVDDMVVKCCRMWQVCFVGIDRTYPPENEAVVEVERQKFLQRQCSADGPVSKTATDCIDSPPSVQFVPRLASEKSRNAVAIDNSSKQLIQTTVLMDILSRATNLVTLENKTWNRGGRFGAHFFSYFYEHPAHAHNANACYIHVVCWLVGSFIRLCHTNLTAMLYFQPEI